MRVKEIYDVNESGEVRNIKTGRFLKTCISGGGYKSLRLGQGGHYYIHRLVAEAFLPPAPDITYEIDHIDRNKLNNHISNLRWVSRAENMRNRGIERRARANKKDGHHHIKQVMGDRQISPTFCVVYNTHDFKHYSSHKTLEEAIEKRDEIEKNIPR